MNDRALFVSLLLCFLGCTGDDDGHAMTRHQVCERLSAATCDRMAICEPTVAEQGCVAEVMASCCPDGVCSELVVADEPHMDACEAAIATMSCSDLSDRDLPEACRHLTDPLPNQPNGGGGSGSSSGSGSGSGSGDPQDEGTLDVNWYIFAGQSNVACGDFLGTTTIRVYLSSADFRDFPCTAGSAATAVPVGTYYLYAEARTAFGQVVQTSQGQTVQVSANGGVVNLAFQVTTSLGQYCDAYATAYCNGCGTPDVFCHGDVYDACCATEGLCEQPALAKPSFTTCVSALEGGGYCNTASGPASCNGAITVW